MSMRSLQTNSARSSWRRDERNFIGISWTTNTSKLRNGGSNDCRKFWMSLMCGSQDLTWQSILSNGVATVRQTLRRMFSAMAAERAKKRRKLVLTPAFANYDAASWVAVYLCSQCPRHEPEFKPEKERRIRNEQVRKVFSSRGRFRAPCDFCPHSRGYHQRSCPRSRL